MCDHKLKWASCSLMLMGLLLASVVAADEPNAGNLHKALKPVRLFAADGEQNFRIPSLTVTSKGTLLAFAGERKGTCHGVNGRGQTIPGTDLLLAPSLVDSPRIKGDPEILLRILLNGLTGPLDGKHYGGGIMSPVTSLGVDHPNDITKLANYLRFAWGHELPPIELDVIQKVKNETADRTTPWTLEELEEDR